MQEITSDQKRGIKTLVRKLGVEDADAMVQGFTGWRTGKVSEMTKHEAMLMMAELKRMSLGKLGMTGQAAMSSEERMRRKLCALAYKYKGLPWDASEGQKRDAIEWLKGWSRKYGKGGQCFNECDAADLPVMVTQLELMLQKMIKAI